MDRRSEDTRSDERVSRAACRHQVEGTGRRRTMRRCMAGARRGAALVEAAIVLMLLIVLTTGLIEFGWFFHVQHTLTGAAAAGARLGIVARSPAVTDTEIRTKVKEFIDAAGIMPADESGVVPYTTSINVTSDAGSQYLKVTVSCQWQAARLIPLGWIGDAKQINGSATMMKE